MRTKYPAITDKFELPDGRTIYKKDNGFTFMLKGQNGEDQEISAEYYHTLRKKYVNYKRKSA